MNVCSLTKDVIISRLSVHCKKSPNMTIVLRILRNCSQAMFTREFDGLHCFAGKLVTFVSARFGSLPANSIVCLISRVSLFVRHLPGSLFTREFDCLPCFAGKPVTFVSAGFGSLPANLTVCPVSRVSRSHLSLPGSAPYPRMLMTLGFHR